ncbi:MAG TPA: G1 family glutamic endopeptidase [Candidatus Saccharimonadales bacterium]|nr:G1 family glutamic endopeptidase [Candidatus Saccharimonadales bacterium]
MLVSKKFIKQIKSIDNRLSNKLVNWQAITFKAPVIVFVIVFGLAVNLPLKKSQTTIQTQNIASSKSIIHKSASPKVTQPASASPPVPVSAPAPVPTAPKAKTVPQAGTPKVEPVVTPAPNSSVNGLTPTNPTPPVSNPSNPPTTTGYLSTNWSGYLATNASFTKVSGSWTATTVTGNGSTISADSTWIGIGGVTSGDLIQVGTMNIVSANGQVSASAFYEILPAVSQPVPGVTVSQGDSMSASITQTSPGQWNITITDNSNGQSASLTVAYASSLSSAEWIEEDPSFSNGHQIPFANFHAAFFTGGSTIANGVVRTIAASTAQPVAMVNNSGKQIAIPSVIGGDGASFSVTQ